MFLWILLLPSICPHELSKTVNSIFAESLAATRSLLPNSAACVRGAVVTVLLCATALCPDSLRATPTARPQALPAQPDILLPEPSRGLLEAEQRRSRVHLVAIARPLQPPASAWRLVAEEPDGRIVRQLLLRSVGAAELAVQLRDFALPPGDSLLVYSPERSDSPVIYTGKGPLQMGDFSTLPMPGDRLVLEWHSHAGSAALSAAMPFQISDLKHHFPSLPPAARPPPRSAAPPPPLPDNGSGKQPGGGKTERQLQQGPTVPEDDRLCAAPGRYQQYREQSAGVIRLLIRGVGRCTGTLLENGMASGAAGHYVLTAEHCLPTPAEGRTFGQWQAVDMTLEWHYLISPSQSSGPGVVFPQDCEDAVALGSQSMQGARLVAWDERFDYALLMLEEDPVETARPQPWSSTLRSLGDELFAIHHARDGQVQQLLVGEIDSFDVNLGEGERAGFLRIFPCRGPELCNFYGLQSSFGHSAGGASGSSLFHLGAEPEAVPRVVAVLSSSSDNGSETSVGILHHAFQLDERFRLALERGRAYFSECGPNTVDLTDAQLAACGRLPLSQLCSALELNVAGCSQISAVAQSPSLGLWSPSTATALFGGSSMGSDPLSADRAACLEITVELPQATMIQFYWQVSSEIGYDWLSFYVGTERRGRISGEQDWQRFAVPVTAGQQPLRWCYEKDSNTNRGADRAWFDSLSFHSSALLHSSMSLSLSEGDAAEELQLILPQAHVGSDVEIVITLAGTAVFGEDYTIAAGEGQTMRLRAGPPGRLRLSLAPATAEPLSLRLLPRPDDRLSQGERTLIIGFASYTSSLAGTEPVVLPTSLQLTIGDDEPPVAEQLSVSDRYACAILRGGAARCWFGKTKPFFYAGLLSRLGYPGIQGALRLAAGPNHLCWLAADGRVDCDGSDVQFFVDGSVRPSGKLLVPAELPATVELAAGWQHNCALSAAGRVRCWGSSSNETTGTSAMVGQSSPPDELPPAEQISAGAYHSCALLRDARVRCWGDNRSGQLNAPPALAAGEIPLLRLEAGGFHNCVLSLGGDIQCWGNNGSGQAEVPADLGKAVHIAAGAFHSCATQRDGVVRCWGEDHRGQLRVPPLPASAVRALNAGGNSSCALLVDGSLRCWGGNSTAVKSIDHFDNAVPDSLAAGDITMVLTPQQLMPGERTAIRFVAPTLTTITFSVKIAVLGEGVAAGVHYRVVDSAGEPMRAEADGSYLLAGNSVPQAFVEALDSGATRALRMYVVPLESQQVTMLPSAVVIPSLRQVAQQIELWLAPASGTATVTVMGGATRLLIAAPEPIALFAELSVDDLRGMLYDDVMLRLHAQAFGAGALVSSATLEFVATAAKPTAIAAVRLPLMGIRVTTVRFSVAEFQAPADLTVEISPETLELDYPTAAPETDITGNGDFDVRDALLILRFMSQPAALLPAVDEAATRERLGRLLPPEVLDLRLDLDGNGRVNAMDLRLLLRYLAGLRGSAIAESMRADRLQALLLPPDS